MDDLDHSVHIAEHEWECFYDESEECSLTQPTLAGSDDSGLSEEEVDDSGRPESPVLHSVQDDMQQKKGYPNTTIVSQPIDKGQATVEGNICSELPVRFCEIGSEKNPKLNDPLTFTEDERGTLQGRLCPPPGKSLDVGFYGESRDSGYFVEMLEEETPGETADQSTEDISRSQDITNDMGLVPESSKNTCITNSASAGACDFSDVKTFDGELPSKACTSSPLHLQSVPLPCNDLCQGQSFSPEQLLCHTETAMLCKRVTREASRGEKERWFVTVNDSPAPPRVQAASRVRKKKKKTCRDLVPRGQTLEQPNPPLEHESEIEKDRLDDFDREAMKDVITQSCNDTQPLQNKHILSQTSIVFPEIPVNYSELSNLFSELSSSSPVTEELIISKESSVDRNVSSEVLAPKSFVAKNKEENDNSAICLKGSEDHSLSKRQDLLFAQSEEDALQFHRHESLDSNEEVELFSTTSTYDSEEEYVSATEIKDTRYNDSPMSKIDSAIFPSLSRQPVTTDPQPLIEEDCLNCPLSPQREDNENTDDHADVKHVMSCDSPAHSVREQFNASEHLTLTNLSENGHKPRPSPISLSLPEVTVPLTESPETSYITLEPTHPVFAISSFWDEMEKLTIKDILHLKVCKSPSSQIINLHPEPDNVVDTDMQDSSLSNTDDHLQDIFLFDTSDRADSDYFTPTDESPKPDRLSCDFSTSDVDEDFMQLLTTSSNPSPEPDDLTQRTPEPSCSGTMSQEEEMESPRGLATPVDCEELAALCSLSEDSIIIEDSLLSEDHLSNHDLLAESTRLIGIKKSRSLRNMVQAFEIAKVDLQPHKMHNVHDLEIDMQPKVVPVVHTHELQIKPNYMPNAQPLEAVNVEIQMNETGNEQVLELKGMDVKTQTKNVQNIHTLEVETQLQEKKKIQALEVEKELKNMLENAKKCLYLNSCQDLDLAETPVLAVIDRISRKPSPILPNTAILDELHRITFPELYEYLFTDDVLSVHESLMSVSDTSYGYCLSKPSQHDEGEVVPIFSCSRLGARDLTFPKLEDILFRQHVTYLQSKEENPSFPCSDIQGKEAVPLADPDDYPPNILCYSQRGWTGNWISMFSLRRICFPGKGISSWCWRPPCWGSPAVDPVQRAVPTTVTQSSQVDSIVNEANRLSKTPLDVIQLGHKTFRQLSEQQRRLKSFQTTVSASITYDITSVEKDGLLFSLRQSDMCLLCIAFASWVLKSADPMAADTWKAALLANVSAISAIQCFRHYVVKRKEGHSEDLRD